MFRIIPELEKMSSLVCTIVIFAQFDRCCLLLCSFKLGYYLIHIFLQRSNKKKLVSFSSHMSGLQRDSEITQLFYENNVAREYETQYIIFFFLIWVCWLYILLPTGLNRDFKHFIISTDFSLNIIPFRINCTYNARI